MSSRSYAQFCGVAAAMDVLGERWAILVVRDLLDGPRRYTDLLHGLPGISTDMLARRLGELEEAGIVRRDVLPPPAASKVYELTDLGRELEPVVHALARWGVRRLAEFDYDGSSQDPRWLELGLRATFDPTAAPQRERVLRVEADDMVVTVRLSRAGLIVDEAAEPDVVLQGSYSTLAVVLSDPDSFLEHVALGDLTVGGPDPDFATVLRPFRLQHGT